jgi:hypothetical protein
MRCGLLIPEIRMANFWGRTLGGIFENPSNCVPHSGPDFLSTALPTLPLTHFKNGIRPEGCAWRG